MNPNPEIFDEVITGLLHQGLAVSDWEILVIDNGSDPPIGNRYKQDFAWHSRTRFLVEPKRGYVYPRRKAIQNAQSDLIIFVDDDCILDPDYLGKALELMNHYPEIGTLGPSISFQCPSGTSRLLKSLHDAYYSNGEVQGFIRTADKSKYFHPAFHGGAGMVLRKNASSLHIERFWIYDELSRQLDRFRLLPIMLEDLDISAAALHQGFAIGRHCALKLVHKTPREKMAVARFLQFSYSLGFYWELFRMRWNWRSYDGKLWWEYYDFLVKARRPAVSIGQWIIRSAFDWGVLKARVFLKQNPGVIRQFAFPVNSLGDGN